MVLVVSLFADFVDDGIEAYRDGYYKVAVDFYSRACNNGNSEGCLELASLYDKEEIWTKGVEKNTTKASNLYKKACTSGNERACLTYNKNKYIQKNEKTNFFTKLCNKNKGIGCFCLAKSLRDEGIVKLYLKACNNGYSRGCTSLAYEYKRGKFIEKNIDESIKLYKKECDKKNGSACNKLGMQFEKNKQNKQSIKYYTEACSNKSFPACSKMTQIYEHGKLGIDKNVTKARSFCIKANLINTSFVCNNI